MLFVKLKKRFFCVGQKILLAFFIKLLHAKHFVKDSFYEMIILFYTINLILSTHLFIFLSKKNVIQLEKRYIPKNQSNRIKNLLLSMILVYRKKEIP